MSEIVKYFNSSKIVKYSDNSSVHNLSEHLLTVGVNMSVDDIQFILLYEYKRSQQYKFELYKLNVKIPNIKNGRVIGAIVGAIVGIAVSILIPGLGIGVVVAALTGASIGWKIASSLSPQAKKSTQDTLDTKGKEQKAISNPGFDSAPQPASIGGVIPMIFADNSSSSGGIRVNGSLLYSNTVNQVNSQYVFLIFSLGLKKLEYINPDKLLINDQLTSMYGTDELQFAYTNGENNQSVLDSVIVTDSNSNPEKFFLRNGYSQSVTPTNSVNVGMTFICKPTAIFDYGTYKTFRVANVDIFDLFNYTDRYVIFRGVDSNDLIRFRVSGKNKNSLEIRVVYLGRLPSTIELTAFSQFDNIYRLNDFEYTTTKKVDSIELNLSFELWSRRDSDGVYLPLASILVLEIDDSPVGAMIYAINSRPGVIRRYIQIYNLPYGFHTIRLKNRRWQGGSSAKKMSDNGSYINYDIGWNIGGKQVIFSVENTGTAENTYAEINNYAGSLLENNTGQSSADSTVTGRVTVINEIVNKESVNQTALTSHPGLSLFIVKLKSSDRLQNSLPSFSHYVEQGIVGKRILAAGTAQINSAGTQLYCNYFPVIPNWRFFIDNVLLNRENVRVRTYVKNIRTGLSGIIDDIDVATYYYDSINFVSGGIFRTTTIDLFWKPGDKFYVYVDYYLDTFPDVYVHTLISELGGLGRIISDKFVDFESIVKAKTFIKNNGYIFNTVIDTTQSWNNYVTSESVGQLLLCTRYGGKYGLLPETYTEPVAIFTSSNIIENNFKETSVNNQKTNAIEITYRAKEDNKFFNKTIVVMTTDAYNNVESYYPESLSINSVSNEAQIIKVAQVALKSRRIQDRMVEFYTGVQGFSLREGELIIVQYGLTEKEAEVSGFCLKATAYFPVSTGGSQIITLSTPVTPGFSTNDGYSLNVYHLKTGTVEKNIGFLVLSDGTILVDAIKEEIFPPSKGFSGDIIIINKNVNEKLFRVSRIEPEPYKVKVQAIFWSTEILTSTGLVTVGNK